tara:strand:- start:41 stop:307 length:267 start_codon:yes stop_codon:yes gene_type:complete
VVLAVVEAAAVVVVVLVILELLAEQTLSMIVQPKMVLVDIAVMFVVVTHLPTVVAAVVDRVREIMKVILDKVEMVDQELLLLDTQHNN